MDDGRLPFDQKFRNFRNGDKWYGNFLGKVLAENPEIVEFPKSEPFNRKFRDESQMKRNFQENFFENLGIPHEVALFPEFIQVPNFLLSASSSFGRDHSELDISRKDDGDAHSIKEIL